MPEIYECFYGLSHLFNFFINNDKEFIEEFKNFEEKTQQEMAENRLKLFTDYGYNGEFEHIH